MAKKALRKTLPSDLPKLFEQAAITGDDAAVRASLEACEPNATHGQSKQPLLMTRGCTPELATWAVARGTDVNGSNAYGSTALHDSARFYDATKRAYFDCQLSPRALIALGADVHRSNKAGYTPLHCAAVGCHVSTVEVLLEHGAVIDALTTEGLTPLESALRNQLVTFADGKPLDRPNPSTHYWSADFAEN